MTDQKGEDGGTGQALHFEPGSSNDLVEDTLLTLEINLPSPAVLSQVPGTSIWSSFTAIELRGPGFGEFFSSSQIR